MLIISCGVNLTCEVSQGEVACSSNVEPLHWWFLQELMSFFSAVAIVVKDSQL